MLLSGLLPLVAASSSFRSLLDRLGQRPTAGIPDAAKAALLAAVADARGRPLVVITARAQHARDLAAQLAAWCPAGTPVLHLPEVDSVPFERVGTDSVTLQARLQTLAGLTQATPGSPAPVVVASIVAATAKTLPPASFQQGEEVLRTGQRLPRDAALARWLRMGYRRAPTVEAPGTMAHRGGILDIFPPSSDLPIRIELWGDTIDNIRLYDPQTQRSVRIVPEVRIVPAREYLLAAAQGQPRPQLDLSGLQPELAERFDRELGLLAEGQPFDGMDFYAPLFPAGHLLDYLPDGALLVWDEPGDCEAVLEEYSGQLEEMRRGRAARGELPSDFPLPSFTWDEFVTERAQSPGLNLERWTVEDALLSPDPLSPLSPALSPTKGEREQDESSSLPPLVGGGAGDGGGTVRLPVGPAVAYGGRLRQALRDVRAALRGGKRVVLVSHQAARLAELLAEEDVHATPIEAVTAAPQPGTLALVHGSLGGGWALTMEDRSGGDLLLMTDAEVFGFAKEPARPLRRRSTTRRDNPLDGLRPGEYVVHIEHGIGRFAGMTSGVQDGITREYLVVHYAEGDKLYVPVEQVDRLSRYVGPSGGAPHLTRLGTQEWTRAKERVQKATAELARELLQTQAARQVVTGHTFSYDTPWQQELEASFPYVETPDQLDVLRDVKTDMEQQKPMDRLICGDVGYGKTEIALRAAFKAVQDGMQVAVLVPTTVLAQQHYSTFAQRLAAFPVRVEVLSRFRSDKEQAEVAAGLKRGEVDICIGTHRLLQKDIDFKNLGLVVIDEEQRFGVLHKEHLKRLRRGVDVLTLTATPIPRTLHMALVGVRDMSTIDTPPEDRLAVRTYVMETNDRIIREAILREIERGGQVFFLHNRVQSIAEQAVRLRALVPEARFAVGHGQMDEEELEEVMADFADGEYDVLVCTTIIESGLDLPRVNTIIINRADRLGLAQLYQLRGRVGRGQQRAYAYLLYERGRALTEVAQKRLQVIFEATELGAGFQIALKDLEIRGAGNLLGPEQSGHIGAVGFDLYCQLLAEAVESARADGDGTATLKPAPAPAPPPPAIDLPVLAQLPVDYIEDLSTRLEVYRRLALAADLKQIEDIAQELHDRFGRLPLPVQNLLWVARLRVLATHSLVRTMTLEEGQAVVRLHEGLTVDNRALAALKAPGLTTGTTLFRIDTVKARATWQHDLERALEALAGALV